MNFITGNNFKQYADYVLDENGLQKISKTINKNHWLTFFVKTNYVQYFFDTNPLILNHKFILITHNSDYTIDETYLPYLQHPNLIKWYAQNVNIENKKLIPIPIGIANQQWAHGDIHVLESIINKNYNKTQLMYANFNIETNPKQRLYCRKHIPSQYIENHVNFKTYLTHTAQSYFSICPIGNGIDSHRIWESLYVRTIPIVEETINISTLKNTHNLPIIIINDWSDLQNILLSTNLYTDIMGSFDLNNLQIDRFIL